MMRCEMKGLSGFVVEIFIFCLLTSPQVFCILANDTNWMGLGVLSIQQQYNVDDRRDTWKQTTVARISRAPKFCHTRAEVTYLQRNICAMSHSSAAAASAGYTDALNHCGKKFEFERWNCSLLSKPRRISKANRNQSRYDDRLIPPGLKGTKEEAFFYAITRAGMANAVTESCSSGQIQGCACDEGIKSRKIQREIKRHGVPIKIRPSSFRGVPKMDPEPTSASAEKNPVKNWKWGECSDNIVYGIKYTRRMIDFKLRNKRRSSLSISDRVNLHNANVGRRVYSQATTLKCSCHGMSGSCGQYTCWRNRANMLKVATELKRLYNSARRVVLRRNRLEFAHSRKEHKRKISKKELIYWRKTPDLCQVDSVQGILGTRGRTCRKSSGDKSDCEQLCCQGGSYGLPVVIKQKCDCKFEWCCDVKCQDCVKSEIMHVCER